MGNFCLDCYFRGKKIKSRS